MDTAQHKVYLIGGAPGAGKTTLGSALATRIGGTSLSVDDLMTAAQAVTTPETHPDLHVMRHVPHLEYFTNSSAAQLQADATRQHEATWPLIERVVRKHAGSGSPIVIDGWHIRPEWVRGLGLATVWAGWIVAAEGVLEEREGRNRGWLEGSSDPDRMLANFLSRSLWFNALMREQVPALGMHLLLQDGETSVEEHCDLVLARSQGRGPT